MMNGMNGLSDSHYYSNLLNEYRMTIDELKAELIQERDERMAEKSEFDHKIAVIMEERERYDTLHELEKESSMIQLKMEGMKWRQERAQLFNRIDEVKAKMTDLEKQAGGEVKHSTPGSSPVHSQREESQKLLQRLETEVEGLDGECWKYRQLADGLKNKMERLTAQNEELKASNDILNQERTILHAKLSNTEQEKSENEVRIKREREIYEMERDKLRDLQMERDELERILQPLQTRIDHLVADSEAVLNKKEQLENSVRTLSAMLDEAEEARQRAENALKESEHNMQNDSSRLRQEFEEEFNLRVKDKNMRIDDLEKEVRTKSKEIENLNERLKSLERDLDESKKSLDDFQKKDVAEKQRGSPSGSPKGSPTRDPEQLRQKLATKEREWSQQRKCFEDTVDRLNSTLKARESAWDNEREDLKNDLTKAQQDRKDKEISWNAERAKLLKEIADLKASLSKSESESKRQVNELRQRLEAATELVETYRLGETKFKEERRRLLQQIEDKESSVQVKQKEIERTQTQLSNQQKRLERVRVEILDRFQREEKVWKAEITACKFKLEAETKYFNDEVGSLQKRLENESNDYQSQKEQLNESKTELDRLRTIVDNTDKEKEALRSERERENLAAKRSRQVLENAQQEKEKLATSLSQEKHRREILQKSYASEKAGWEVSRNEMMAKIARLEQQTKLKKVKLEDLQARLQASWDQERSEHKRILTEANYRVMEMQKEMERRDSQRSREGSGSEGVLAKKLLEDERRKSTERIHELGAELQKSKDGHKRIGQLEARYQRDRELWRKERSDLQKRLQDCLATRRLEHNKIDSFIQDLQNLKGAVEATDRLTRTDIQNGGRHEQIIVSVQTQKTVVKTTETKPLQKAPPPAEENNAIYRQLRKQVSEPSNVCTAAAEKSNDVVNSGSAPVITHRHSTSERPATFTLDENASPSARTGIEERSKSQSDMTRRDSGPPPKPPAKPPRQFSQKDESSSSTSSRMTSQAATTPRQQTQGEYLQSRRSQSRSAEVLTSSPTKSPRSPVKVISSDPVGGGLEIATTKPTKASTKVKTVVTETKERRTQAPPTTKIEETERAKCQETHFGKIPHVTIIDKDNTQSGKKTTVTEIVQESKTTVQESKVPVASSTPDVSQIGSSTSRRPPQVSITRSVSDRRHDADKPTIVVKQGRFDVMGLLRETDRKTTRPRSESPSRVDLQIRLAEIDKNRVMSTKMMFEGSQPSPSGSAPALQRRSASTDSPCVSDTDSERHTDSELVARSPTNRQLSPSISDSRLPGDSRAASGASPQIARAHESRSSERPKSMCANIDRKSKTSSEGDSLGRTSPYPNPPPGFLLPKHINGTTSKPSVATSPTVAAARGVSTEPPRGKSYNVPIPPSELGSFGEGPLTHIPGQLPRTKSQLQAQTKQPMPPLSNKTPPESPKHGSERGKRVSPRSARAQFFSEAPSPTSNKSLKSQVAAQERKTSNNNNNATAAVQQHPTTSSGASSAPTSSTKSRGTGSSSRASSSSGAKGASGGTVKGGSGSSKSDVGTSTRSSHQPPSKASPWSASPAVSIPQQQRMGTQPATKPKKSKFSSKSSKK
ncbi:interaptin-like isoform X1 [Lytechinus pictus]|uniref:interaptin-like isoform X1 n=1 Tax=Lytechinus pictus TaxID=7653 RepID=UPI0030BA1030